MKILTKIHRCIKRIDPNCVLRAKRKRYCNTLWRMIEETRKEADDYEKEGRHEIARAYRNFADSNEIRMKLTLLL